MLDADAFTRFEDADVIDASTGKAFRETILARGDEAPPEALFEAFMGRPPSPDALLKRLGLVS